MSKAGAIQSLVHITVYTFSIHRTAVKTSFGRAVFFVTAAIRPAVHLVASVQCNERVHGVASEFDGPHMYELLLGQIEGYSSRVVKVQFDVNLLWSSNNCGWW